jgi:hypothetical protein
VSVSDRAMMVGPSLRWLRYDTPTIASTMTMTTIKTTRVLVTDFTALSGRAGENPAARHARVAGKAL